ncbi:MAG: hypothetical protein ACYTGH_11820 [Planctomycetota bacterium]|jgi:hypothetical protein
MVRAFICLFLLLSTTLLAAEPLQVVTLKESLDVDFEHELVHFELNDAAQAAKGALHLVDEKGAVVPSQLNGTTLSLVTDLARLETKAWKVMAGAARAESDLEVKETDAQIELLNARTGVRIPKTLEEARSGPIDGVRVGKAWTGTGSLSKADGLTAYEAKVTRRGPVYADVRCLYTFGEKGPWTVTLRLIAGDPAILVSEASTLGRKSEVTWRLHLALDKPINTAFFRSCMGNAPIPKGGNVLKPIKPKRGFNLQMTAWYTWWSGGATTGAGFFHLPEGVRYERTKNGYNRTTKAGLGEAPAAKTLGEDEELEDEDLDAELDGEAAEKAPPPAPEKQLPALCIAVGKPAEWVRKAEGGRRGEGPGRSTLPLQVNSKGELRLSMGLNRIGRRWLIGVGTVGDVIANDRKVALPQKLYAKHLGTSLAMIQKMVLDWPQTLTYPSLLFSKDKYEAHPLEIVEKDGALWGGRGDIVKYYLNRNPAARKKRAKEMAGAAKGRVGYAMSWYLPRDGNGRNVAENQAPHEQGMATYRGTATADYIMGTEALSEEERKVIRARLALLCYRGLDENTISHAKGLRNFPNMSIFSYTGVGMASCVIGDHPEVKTFQDEVIRRVRRDLKALCGPNGGWRETPHYQGAAMDAFMWYGLALKKLGREDIVFDENLKKAVRFLAMISTPRDPRFSGKRHLPEIGNTYIYEPSSQFGLIASIWREKDPAFAEGMQWMFREQGMPGNMGVGGDAGIHWHSHMIVDKTWEAKTPSPLGSELFPMFGAVLRSHAPSDRETYMLYHVGPWLFHYDNDMGQIMFWGKGRPLAVDFGYQGCMPGWQHSKVDRGSNGKMVESALQASTDYLHGHQAGWSRRILFLKDKDVEGASWILLRDSLNPKSKPAAWWYWMLTKEAPTLKGEVMTQTGTFDVDCDIWFGASRSKDLKRLTNKEARDAEPLTADAPDAGGLGEDELDDELALDEGNDAAALSNRIKTTQAIIKCGATGKKGEISTTQEGVKLTISPAKPVPWALFPRLRDEEAPVFTAIAEGQGLRVKHSRGTDYAFLAEKAIEWTGDGITFSGTVGAVQIREGEATLTLSAKGSLDYKGTKVVSDGDGVSKSVK